MKVACVLRSGGEYNADHVASLRDQVAEYLPAADFVCFSDVDVPCERIPLEHDWPGWWAKMELFRPDIPGGLLYLDLDSRIVGDLSSIAARRRLTVLSDFYWPGKIQSSMMLVPQAAKAEIWQAFTTDPDRHMRECVTRERWGDQGFLGGFWQGKADRWQDVLPGQVVSYKVHVRRAMRPDKEFGTGSVPDDARVVIFHGKPRPWQVPGFEGKR